MSLIQGFRAVYETRFFGRCLPRVSERGHAQNADFLFRQRACGDYPLSRNLPPFQGRDFENSNLRLPMPFIDLLVFFWPPELSCFCSSMVFRFPKNWSDSCRSSRSIIALNPVSSRPSFLHHSPIFDITAGRIGNMLIGRKLTARDEAQASR